MKKYTMLVFFLISFISFGQEDLEEIFEDSKGEFKFNIGVDFLRILTGTPSIQFGSNINNEKILLRGELGSTIMGYRLQMRNKMLEKKVKPGYVLGINACHSVFNFNGQYEGKFYLGFEVQYWNYNAENDNVLMDSGNNEYSINGAEFYAEDNFSFAYSMKSLRIGLIYGYVMPINKKLDFQTFISFGKSSNKIKYDESSSSGIQWIDNAPEGWQKLNGVFYMPFYGRFTLGITYNIL